MKSTVITSKGTTTIPKEVRDYLNLKPGSRLTFAFDKGGVVIEKALTLEEVRHRNQIHIHETMPDLTLAEAKKRADKARVAAIKKKYRA